MARNSLKPVDVGEHRIARPPTKVHGLRRFATTWGRAVVIAAAFSLQLGLLFAAWTFLAQWSTVIFGVQLVLGVGALLHILNSRMESAYKLAWAVPVLVAPLVGTALYLTFGTRRGTRRQRRRQQAAQDRAEAAMALVPTAEGLDGHIAELPIRRQLTFLSTASHYRSFDQTRTSYYPVGEEGFEAMIEAIGQARRYVFAEYFIVGDGVMLDRLLNAMAAKAAEGLDVRFLYDDLGSFFTLPVDFRRRCREAGITVVPVNPVGLGFTTSFQNRDHRKILVVDGHVAFTGGINIADEYINEKLRFGHWKDSVIRLEGPGSWGFTVMFLHMWELATDNAVAYEEFVPDQAQLPAPEPAPGPEPTPGRELEPASSPTGLVAPFDDSPFDDLYLGLDLHQLLLNGAARSVDIFTPYLVITDNLVEQLRTTARSGIRVRIVTPHIPDKWYVHLVTRSYYRSLMEAGVEIHEYTPGFIHSKSILVDDDVAIVGTINFDFRSFFLHQECAVWLYQTPALKELRRDVEETLRVSHRITMEELKDRRAPKRLLQAVLRAFAPMM